MVSKRFANTRAARHRAPLFARKRAERRAAQGRIAARTTRAMTADQRANDPTVHRRADRAATLGAALIVLLGSGAVHGSVIGVGVLISGADDDGDRRTNERVTIEMRERVQEKREKREQEKKDEKQNKEQEKKPEVVGKPVLEPRPKKVEAPKPEPVEEEPETRRPPPRVVGISLGATTEGGGGPSFAVGHTRDGKNAETAVAPEDLAEKPGPEVERPVRAAPAPVKKKPNRTASRIPTTGVKFVLPKRKKPSRPAYPGTLKAQGIEADVPVMVSLDATGAVIDVKILKSSGYRELDRSAREAALAEEFTPALKNGVPVPYRLSFTYRFRLEDQ